VCACMGVLRCTMCNSKKTHLSVARVPKKNLDSHFPPLNQPRSRLRPPPLCLRPAAAGFAMPHASTSTSALRGHSTAPSARSTLSSPTAATPCRIPSRVAPVPILRPAAWGVPRHTPIHLAHHDMACTARPTTLVPPRGGLRRYSSFLPGRPWPPATSYFKCFQAIVSGVSVASCVCFNCFIRMFQK
jgi:hypothetical protein